jgi:hypothetical protein
MRKNYVKILLLLFLLNPKTLYATWNQPSLTPPGSWQVTSDYGPRNVTNGTWFHRGVDYGGSYGNSIYPVEDGTVAEIKYDHGWYIKISGYHGDWTYLHIFTGTVGNTPVTSGNKWELRDATLVNPNDTTDTEQKKVIIIWASGNTATKVLSTIPNYWVQNDDGTYITGTDGPIKTRNTVSTADEIAPVGNSGGYATHLHLAHNGGDDNPFYHVIHDQNGDALPTATIESPPNNHTFTKAELNSNYPVKVRVNSVGGLDLDEVELWIYKNKDNQQAMAIDGGTWQPIFGYGGQPVIGKTATIVSSTGSTTGVHPNGGEPGDDTFYYFQNFGSLNLPAGEHALVAKLKDVNGNVSQEFINYFNIRKFPIVKSAEPEDGSYNIATNSKITISFDSEMNTSSVESSLSASPAISGSFAWSSDKKTLTITPSPGLSENADYEVTISDAAMDNEGNILDGDRNDEPGGNYTFRFSTKKAAISVMSISHDYKEGNTYWVKEGTKTVTVQLTDYYGNPLTTDATPVFKWKSPRGTVNNVALSLSDSSQSKWTGTVTISNGQDGQSIFESDDHTPVTGISSFMIDTTPPEIESASVTSPNCNCPNGPLAFKFNATDSGSGVSSVTPVGLGLSANGCYGPGSYQYGASSVTDKAGNTTSMTGSISVIQNKCTNPDDNYSVTIMNIPGATLPSINIAGKKVAVLGNGYAYSAQRFLSDKVVIESTIIDPDFSPEIYTEYPLLIIPTGGLSGLVQSEMFKAKLAKYVENGGVILAFSQNQGYEFEALPGGKVTGYGYTNDQQCFTNAAYIDGWHQIFSGQGKANLDLNIDGFMTGIPEEGQTFLKRVANGQSALAVYPYGNGYVIATTLYTDWGYSVSQYTTQEINLVRDIVAWAKMPMELPEIKPGETVSLSVPVMNNTSTDAVNVKIVVRDPAKNLIAEFSNPMTLAAGEYAELPFTYTASAAAPLGIWWVDYTIIDSNGGVIQPEYEGARFAVATRPQNAAQQAALSFSVLSDSENYSVGSNAVFTIMAFNSGDMERTITARYAGQSQTLTVPPKGSASVTYTELINYAFTRGTWLTAYFYDENDRSLGNASKRYWSYTPAANVMVKTDKDVYEKGEAVNITLDLQNRQNAKYNCTVKLKILNPSYVSFYNETLNINLDANVISTQNLSFILPHTAPLGFYTISAEAFDSTGAKIGGNSTNFEIPQSQVSVMPNFTSTFGAGTNIMSFILNNTGRINVSSGTLDINLKDPESVTVYIGDNVQDIVY